MNVDDALQYCLDGLDTGRLTLAECAVLFPQLEDLPAQLAAAQALRSAPAPQMSSAAQAALQTKLLAHWRARSNGHAVERAIPRAGRRQRPAPAPRRGWGWRWRALMPRLGMALTAVVVLLAASAGTLSAAGASLPGQWLYPVKRSVETWQLAWTPAADQAAARLELIAERSEELQALAEQPAADPALLAATAGDFAEQTAAAVGSVAAAPAGERVALLEAMLAAMDTEKTVLEGVIARAPAQAVPALIAALAQTQAEHERALVALEGARAGTDTPPGQTQVPPGQTRRPDQTNPPPGQTRVPPGQTLIPPGQADKTATRTPRPTFTPRPTHTEQGGEAVPNCSANNPNSPNYCTPTPGGAPADVAPTACPTNPGGQSRCK